MMPHWSVLLELYSLVILLVLFLRCYRYGRELTKKANLEQFSRCLLLSMAFILLNLLCMGTLARTDIIPVPINLVLNSAYFLLAIHLCTAYAQILFRDMLQHVYQEKCKRRARIGLTAITALGDGCIVLNLFTGILFYFDAAGNYRRGPLNRIQFLWLLAEIGMLAMCYYRNRASISPQSVSVMRNAPAIAAILSVVQIFFPDLLLNGTTCALISLIMFFSYCSHSQTQDGLTGLGNRMVFLDELSGYLGQPLQIVQVSLLNLADLNVAYGHATGDNLLYEMGAFLRKTGVQVFRTGSTTFTLIAPFTREEKADALLDTVQIRMRQDWQFGAVSFRIAFAMAEARYPRVPDSISQVVEELEYTMLQARKKQKLVRFDETLRRELYQRDRLLEWMRLCIGENKFRVVYQPIYCCRQGLFCAAEALLRLDSESGEPISPEVFIPLAEETNLIGALTQVVLENACQVLNRADLPGLDAISVNLSMRQFLDPRLPEMIGACLERHRLPAHRLRLEITESFVLQDAGFAKQQMEALDRLGIRLYMDDFGTGYSNLSAVLQYPFTYIKLDRSLIAPLPEDGKAAIMVQTLLNLFQRMGKKVIAEGVENAAQADFLLKLGVNLIQGYYYARPMDSQGLCDYFGCRKEACQIPAKQGEV